MISIKKYLDAKDLPLLSSDISDSTIECYRGLLLALGRNAVRGCPALGSDLEHALSGFERRLSVKPSPSAVKHTQKQVEVQLQEWGDHTAEHFRTKSDEVKELLLALAKTAEFVGDRNQNRNAQFKDLTTRLENIASLDDLTQIRTSIVSSANELRTQVEQMARESKELVDQLRSEVSEYENRLKAVESLVLKDELTGIASRRTVEHRIQCCIENKLPFCIVMLDLNEFKRVNDQYGHPAGDDLLRQFATELQTYVRSGDMVGRWGGDEFIVLLATDAAGAGALIDRMREWVFGRYTIHRGAHKNAAVIHVDASLGLAEWRDGVTMNEIVAEADAAMYRDKNQCRSKTATLLDPAMV